MPLTVHVDLEKNEGGYITKIIYKISYITKTNILYIKTVIACVSTSASSDSGISSRIPTYRETGSFTFFITNF